MAGGVPPRVRFDRHWDIGKAILDRQTEEGWGAKVIDRLAKDLGDAYPDMKGFSPRNLKYMRVYRYWVRETDSAVDVEAICARWEGRSNGLDEIPPTESRIIQ